MKYRKIILASSLMLIVVIASTACSKPNEEINQEKVLKQVETYKIDKNNNESSVIKVSGAIKAETQIDVTATTRGMVRAIHFKVGDDVRVNKILASLYDGATLTGLNNAQTNQNNMKSNLDAITRITEETVRQAELGIQAAKEQIESAEIGLNSAKTNLNNAKNLKTKGNLDANNQAVISFESNLNTVDTTLDQVNYIIQADNTKKQISGIADVISAQNKSTLLVAKTQYNLTESNYKSLQAIGANSDNIISKMTEMGNLLSLVRNLVDNTIEVLDNTVSSQDFSSATLDAQKTALITTRGTISSYQTSAKTTLQNLQNQGLTYNQEIDVLENAVASAENRLSSANTSYENSLISLENTKQSKEQQIISSKSTLDNANGQLNLARVQTGDLSIKAPVSGQITQKYVELGAEINPGQKIAQITDANTVKIEVDLPSSDIYRIDEKGEVKIGENMTGLISSINSTADSLTKKVRVEILYDNKNKDLIPGTFIDCSIPTKKQEKTSADSVYVPLKAINVQQNENIVFVLEGNIAKKVLVEIGNANGKMMEITKGLKQDDKLIINGNKSIEDGEEVELLIQESK